MWKEGGRGTGGPVWQDTLLVDNLGYVQGGEDNAIRNVWGMATILQGYSMVNSLLYTTTADQLDTVRITDGLARYSEHVHCGETPILIPGSSMQLLTAQLGYASTIRKEAIARLATGSQRISATSAR